VRVSDEVYTSLETKERVQQMSRTLNDAFFGALNQIIGDGQFLSDEANWRGGKADQFRTGWTSIEQSLRNVYDGLVELNTVVDGVTNDILAAGGTG
jgi:hypothetical protein